MKIKWSLNGNLVFMTTSFKIQRNFILLEFISSTILAIGRMIGSINRNQKFQSKVAKRMQSFQFVINCFNRKDRACLSLRCIRCFVFRALVQAFQKFICICFAFFLYLSDRSFTWEFIDQNYSPCLQVSANYCSFSLLPLQTHFVRRICGSILARMILPNEELK